MRKFSVIFLILICIVIIFTAGCTSIGSTSAQPAPTPQIVYITVLVTPNSIADPVKTQSQTESLKFSGSGSDSQGFSVTGGGGFMFTGNYSGKGNFIVHIIDNNGEFVEGLFNSIGSYSGRKVIHLDPGKYYLDVFIASGPWTIDMSPT
jgi:hypothetical protein